MSPGLATSNFKAVLNINEITMARRKSFSDFRPNDVDLTKYVRDGDIVNSAIVSSATSYVSVFNKLFAGDNFGTFIEANIVHNVTLNIQLVRHVSLLSYSTIRRRQLIFTITVSNLFIASYEEKSKFSRM